MEAMQKWGGGSTLVLVATLLFGLGLMLFFLIPGGYEPDGTDAGEALAFLVDNQAMFYAWTLVIYIVFGCFLVVAALALHQRLRTSAPELMGTSTAFGLIWAGLVLARGMLRINDLAVLNEAYGTDSAQAESAWLAMRSVEEGLGGAIELVGGLWILLASVAALRGSALPRTLDYLGILVGAAGVLTVVPALGELATVFGVGAIVWFAWLGVVMLRHPDAPAASEAAHPPSSTER